MMRTLDQIVSGGFTNPSTLQGAILYAIVFAFFAWLVGRTLRSAVQRVLAHDKHDHLDIMAVRFIAKLVRYCVYIFAFISYAHFIPVLSGLGAASLTSISVLSLILGLAAQNTLGNLVAGISLLLYRPFKLGDRLQVLAPTGLEIGTVESLTLGYTLLQTDDNRRVVVPNSLMANQTTINLTGGDPRTICTVPIGISYDSDIDKARGILLDLAGKHPKTLAIGGCPLTQLGNAGVVLTLEVWCADSLTATALRCDLFEQTVKRFTQAGIGIPVPQTAVTLKREN